MDVFQDGDGVVLIWMARVVEDPHSSMDRVSNNVNSMGLRDACCIGNTTSYGEELCLGCCHFESVLFGFVDSGSADPYVRNSGGLVIFDAGIMMPSLSRF